MDLWRKLCMGMPFLAFAILDLQVKSCPEDHFLLPDQICCHFCPEGRFVTINCTRNNIIVTGVKCSPCTECANGTQMIAPCTPFTDTQCLVKKAEITTSTRASAVELLYVITPVVFIMIFAAVGYKWCLRRREETLKIMI